MKTRRYLALLRGVNVGGNNMIKMAALKASFDKLGFTNVATFIQSGNVFFESAENDPVLLTARIEKAVSEEFNYQARVVVLSRNELKRAVEDAPKGFGSQPAKYRYDVIFLKAPLTPKSAIQSVPIKAGVDQAFAGKRVLYFSRLISKATQSRLPRIVQLPIYQNMTIRNWNTTTRLLDLMDAKVTPASAGM